MLMAIQRDVETALSFTERFSTGYFGCLALQGGSKWVSGGIREVTDGSKGFQELLGLPRAFQRGRESLRSILRAFLGRMNPNNPCSDPKIF